MKNQVLFSSNDKSKKLKCRLLQFLIGTLRVRELFCHQQSCHRKTTGPSCSKLHKLHELIKRSTC